MSMSAKPAQYLIRFDDLCPTMSRDRFERFQSILTRYRIRPILAVVPDNQDPELKIQDPDPEFWERMRALEAQGATIAMHGYRHLCLSRGRPLVALHTQSEFAGVPETTQREWLHTGLKILRAHSLNPRLFVAPRHGFDRATLRALFSEGLRFVSDGFAKRPFARGDIVWIPQQIWEPVPRKSGLWTTCIHSNAAPISLEEKLETFLKQWEPQFTSFDRVLAEYEPVQLTWFEQMTASLANYCVRVRF